MICDECGTYCARGLVGLISHVQQRHHVDLPRSLERREREERRREGLSRA